MARRNTYWAVLALSGLIATAGAFAFRSALDQAKEQPRMTEGAVIVQASDLAGANVLSRDNRDLGDLQDLVIDVQDGRVAFAVISLDEVKGQLFLLPLSQLQIRREKDDADIDAVILQADVNQLKAGPNFSDGNWTGIRDPQILSKYGETWRTRAPRAESLHRASQLNDFKVKNSQGENLGDVEDIVVNVRNRRIYAVLSVGGFLGIGEKLHAVPWKALSIRDADTALLDIDKEKLKAAPTFDKNQWTTSRDTRFIVKVHEYYGMSGIAGGAKRRIVRSTEVIGYDVKNPQGENLGDLEDLAVDAANGQVAYAVLSFGGILGIGDKLFAIPWKALQLHETEKIFVLNLPKDKLKNAPGFDEKQWPNMADPQFSKELSEFYGTEETQPAANITKMSDLLDADVRNAQNQNLGDLDEIVLDLETGRIAYGVLSSGGFLGIGDKLYPIPWAALRFDAKEKDFIVNLPKEKLDRAPGFDEDRWPEVGDDFMILGMHDYYGFEAFPQEGEERMGRKDLEKRNLTLALQWKNLQAEGIRFEATQDLAPEGGEEKQSEEKRGMSRSRHAYDCKATDVAQDGGATLEVTCTRIAPSGASLGETEPRGRAADEEPASVKLTMKCDKDGRITELGGAETLGSIGLTADDVKRHFTYILGSGLHQMQLEAGKVYAVGELKQEQQATHLRYDGVADERAHFTIVSQAEGGERGPETGGARGQASYHLSDGLLHEIELRSISEAQRLAESPEKRGEKMENPNEPKPQETPKGGLKLTIRRIHSDK